MTLPDNVYFYEFLYRGRPANSTTPPAWQVILAVDSTDAFGNVRTDLLPAMTPEQAEAAGSSLPTIIAAINAASLAQVTALQEQVTALQEQVTSITSDKSAAESQVASLNAQVTSLRAQLAALQNPASSGTLTFLQFMALLTPSERAAFVSSDDPGIKLFVLMAAGSGGMQLDNPQVVEGVNYATTKGILTSDRAAQILAGTSPSA